MTDLEKSGIIGTLEKILHECREIIEPDMYCPPGERDKEESEPHLKWLEEVKAMIEDLGMPPDEEKEDEEEDEDPTAEIRMTVVNALNKPR
jgi:hypothetical protein